MLKLIKFEFVAKNKVSSSDSSDRYTGQTEFGYFLADLSTYFWVYSKIF